MATSPGDSISLLRSRITPEERSIAESSGKKIAGPSRRLAHGRAVLQEVVQPARLARLMPGLGMQAVGVQSLLVETDVAH